jgi:hypothetical protein
MNLAFADSRTQDPGEFDAVHVRKPKVHQGDIGSERLEVRDRFGSIRCLPHNFEIILILEDRTEPIADQRMIIHDEHFDVGRWVHASVLAASLGYIRRQRTTM